MQRWNFEQVQITQQETRTCLDGVPRFAALLSTHPFLADQKMQSVLWGASFVLE